MTCVLRRAFAATVSVVVGCAVLGCSGESSQAGASGSTGTSRRAEPAFIGLQVTPSLSITIENLAPEPLLDVNVTIKPATGDMLYTTILPRLEPREKRNLVFGQFRRSDGTPFSAVLAFVRPKEVIVTGRSVETGPNTK
jgi:hypothetical protein